MSQEDAAQAPQDVSFAQRRIHLILEIHCYPQYVGLVNRLRSCLGLELRPMNSLWIVPGEYDEQNEEHHYEAMGARVSGPAPAQEVEELFGALCSKFRSAGFEVLEHFYPDD